MASKTEKRAAEILHLLLQQGKASVDQLTSTFATSPASIRRDLARLEERGLVHRTHGGAMLANQTYEAFRFDASFPVREERFTQEKHRIAHAAAELVQEGETLGITAGTTTTQLARALHTRSRLRIITNAVNIGMELSTAPEIETVLTGGSMRWPTAFSLIGPMALESLNTVLMDKVFLGVCGIDPRHGATLIEHEEAALFRSMTCRGKEIVVLADSSKVGLTSPAVICPIHEIDVLVTDEGISPGAADALRQAGVRVVVC